MIDIINDSMLKLLDYIEPNSIDSIVTDPPYELNFMGKGWDNAGVSFNVETWKKCFDVLKPGGYLLAFGGSRTFHRIAVTIEDAGFEIRDTIMWLYGKGFPKGLDISKQIDKKLGAEREVIGVKERKPVFNSPETIEQQYGFKTGTFNITAPATEQAKQWSGWNSVLKPAFEPIIVARKPFKGSLVDNVLEHGVGGLNIDECRVGDEERVNKGMKSLGIMHDDNWQPKEVANVVNGRFPANVILDDSFTEEWSRYFYCAKASKKDRDDNNTHTTVKPTSLMQYLIRLVTPKGGTVLDPFMGSGSTGKAVAYENKERNANYSFIGIEVNEDYCDIAEARITKAIKGAV